MKLSVIGAVPKLIVLLEQGKASDHPVMQKNRLTLSFAWKNQSKNGIKDTFSPCGDWI